MKPVSFQYSLRWFVLVLAITGVGTGLAVRFPTFWFEIIAASLTAAVTALVLIQEDRLGFFLKYVNPLLALIVLGVCLMAGSTGENRDSLKYVGFFKSPIPTYFVAKGNHSLVSAPCLSRRGQACRSPQPRISSRLARYAPSDAASWDFRRHVMAAETSADVDSAGPPTAT